MRPLGLHQGASDTQLAHPLENAQWTGGAALIGREGRIAGTRPKDLGESSI